MVRREARKSGCVKVAAFFTIFLGALATHLLLRWSSVQLEPNRQQRRAALNATMVRRGPRREGRSSSCRSLDLVRGTSPLQKDVKSCALVTTSGGLLGKGLGAEIDRHEWVIRANRLPTGKYCSDYGARTDVLFLNCLMARMGTGTLMGPPTPANCTLPHCYSLVHCSTRKDGCNVGAIVLRGIDCFEYNQEELLQVWAKSPFNVSVAPHTVEMAIRSISKKWRKGVPTTGLMALMVAFSRCKRISLYGFDDHESVDKHAQDPKHDVPGEHKMIAHMIRSRHGGQLWTKDQQTKTTRCLLNVFRKTPVTYRGQKARTS